jgi:glycosyltransferase involved in cell wall biosynthesis
VGPHPARESILAAIRTVKSYPSRFFNLTTLVRRYAFRLPLRDLLRAMRIAVFVLEILARERVNLFHIHQANAAALGVLSAARALHIPMVLTVYGVEFQEHEIHRRRRLACDLCQTVDRVLAISNHTRQLARSAGVQTPIDVIYPPVDCKADSLQQFDTHSTFPVSLCPSDRLVLYAGWLIERKGVMDLLEAIHSMPPKPDEVFVFVGPDHGARERMVSFATNRLANRRVHILDSVSEDILHWLFSRADIAVLPTRTPQEGFGLVLAEAVIRGAALIGSKVGGIQEIVLHEQTGLLFEPGNAAALACAIRRLLDEDDLRHRLVEAGRKRVCEMFSTPHVAAQLWAIYESAVRPNGRESYA